MVRWIPILRWLPEYQRSWIRGDLVSGSAIWSVLVPIALAYGAIAGVEPVVGLYTVPMALFGYAIFGGQRLFVVGPDAAVAVLSGGIVASVAVGVDEYLALTVSLALVVGVLYVLFSILKMGWIADLVPDPVLKGFTEGIIWITILKQFAVLLGIAPEQSSHGFFHSLIGVITAYSQTHFATAAIGIASIAVLVLIRRFAPRLPGPIIVLVGSIILVGLFGLDEDGVAVIGHITGGFPDLEMPSDLDFDKIATLSAGALAIVVLGFTKSLPALKQASEKTGETIDPNCELLAIGASNIAAGFGGGYAVAGSLTATKVSSDSGGQTQIANLFAAVLCILTILFLLPALSDLASASLAAIIVVALAGISNLGYFRTLWAIDRFEFMVGLASFFGVLWFGVMPGVIIGVVLALLKLAYYMHAPTTTIVARTPSGAFVDIDEHPEAKPVPGLLILRIYGPLVFLNARVLSDKLRSIVIKHRDIQVIVLDATASLGIDTSAANKMIGVIDEFYAKGINLWVVNPRQRGWDRFVAVSQVAKSVIPPIFSSLSDALVQFEQTRAGK